MAMTKVRRVRVGTRLSLELRSRLPSIALPVGSPSAPSSKTHCASTLTPAMIRRSFCDASIASSVLSRANTAISNCYPRRSGNTSDCGLRRMRRARPKEAWPRRFALPRQHTSSSRSAWARSSGRVTASWTTCRSRRLRARTSSRSAGPRASERRTGLRPERIGVRLGAYCATEMAERKWVRLALTLSEIASVWLQKK
jgi:hypothetical protein